MPNLNYSIISKAGKNYEVTNHETGQTTIVSVETIQNRTECFTKLKEINCTKEERSKIYDEIFSAEHPPIQEVKKQIDNNIESFDKISVAKQFIQKQPLYYDTNKIWWGWNNETKAWEMIDETDICNALRKEIIGIPIFESKTRTEILNSMQMVARENKPKEPPKKWLQFKDKIVDLETHLVQEATPEWFITNPIPHKLGTGLETPTFDKLFSEWVETKYTETLYEIMAYCLLPDYPIHSIFCLLGEGRNGKGTYLHLIEKLVGEKNVCSSTLQRLLENRFESGSLFRKLVCCIGEIGMNLLKQSDELRRLAGGDLVRIEFKQKSIFSAYNYAKIILAVNSLPETCEKTRGFYSRWLIVDFYNVFTKSADVISGIPEEEWENLCARLCKALLGVLKRGEFTNQGTFAERAERYEERASKLNDWLKKCCEVNNDKECPFWMAYGDYIAFLNQQKARIVSKIEFSIILRAKGFFIYKKDIENEDGTKRVIRYVQGVGLKN